MKVSGFFLGKISPVAYLLSVSIFMLSKIQTLVLDLFFTKAAPAAFFYRKEQAW